VETAARLRQLGHSVTVHVAARMVRDRDHLDQLLAGMADAGIEDLFLIAGDVEEPVGDTRRLWSWWRWWPTIQSVPS
jgi:methylenetetrahydrofolate reductase (NADPH)